MAIFRHQVRYSVATVVSGWSQRRSFHAAISSTQSDGATTYTFRSYRQLAAAITITKTLECLPRRRLMIVSINNINRSYVLKAITVVSTTEPHFWCIDSVL